MIPATGDEAAANHTNQHDNGATRNWGAAESKKRVHNIHACSDWLDAKSCPVLVQQFHHILLRRLQA
jgi:hypothetical protein